MSLIMLQMFPGAGREKIPEKKAVTYLVSQAYIDHLKAGLFHCVDEIAEDAGQGIPAIP